MALPMLVSRCQSLMRQQKEDRAMQHQNTIFHELLKSIPRQQFEKIVKRHDGDKYVRQLNCWTQMIALIYTQLQNKFSLRDVEAAMSSHANLTYHLGAKDVRRSTLSVANAKRPAALFEDVFSLLLGKLQGGGGHKKTIKEMKDVVRLIDATVIKLGMSSKEWAQFSDKYSCAKGHFVYDPDDNIPVYFAITKGKTTDMKAARNMPIEAGATYVFDMGYYGFDWWAKLHDKGCRFVTRLKKSTNGRVIETRRPKDENILYDRVIKIEKRLKGSRKNPLKDIALREIGVVRDNGKILRFVTNDLEASAEEISELYKRRWAIELFFKWIKQNLKIKKFLGTSENAIRIQIITAMITYLLIKLANNTLPNPFNMTRLTRLVSTNLMQRKKFKDLLKPPRKPPNPDWQKQQLKMEFDK